MKAGFAQSDITPPIGTVLGSVRPRPMTGVHDPLLATACVIDDGKTPLALVGADVGVIPRATFDAATRMIARQTGIPAANVIISASHTHTGGPMLSLFNGQADPAYANIVAGGVADAATRAWHSRTDAQLAHGFARVIGIHFNRRFVMRDGREVTHPGKLHPDIIRPAGPVDDKVGVLAFRDANQKIIGIVVHFACHCTVTEDGSEFSADYVHYLRAHLQQQFGDVGIVFLLGACGDVTQIDNQRAGSEKGHTHADMMGATLASEAARTLERFSWSSAAACLFADETVSVQIRDRDYCDPPTLGLGSGEQWNAIYTRERQLVQQMRRTNPTLDCHITALRIAPDLAIVTNGAELFAQPALDIQRASPVAQTWVVTLANEYVGYVPTAAAHSAGGYEVRTARSSFLAVDAADKIVETSLRLLCENGK